MVKYWDEDENPIPEEFFVYYERWGFGWAGYQYSPSGIALCYGVLGLAAALLTTFIPAMPGDWHRGSVFLALSVVLLVVSRIALIRQRRSFDRRMAALETWKAARRAEQSG